MPFNGSGGFSRVMDWTNDASANIKIRADRHDQNDDDIAQGLGNTICRDGQSTVTADIPFANHKLIQVAPAANPTDAATLADITNRAVRYDAAMALTPAQQLVAHTNLADTSSVLAKSANYTLAQADRNKLLRITATMNLTLPAASVVGNDFAFDFRINSAAVTMTLVPNGTDQIEGVNANLPIAGSGTGTVWSDGTGWLVSFNAAVNPKVTYVTATNAAFALDKMTKHVEFELQAPGGGSGALAASSASTMGVVGGAGGGERCVLKVDNPNVATTWNITIGAPGVGGVAGSTASSAGGTCTVTDGTNTMTCIGGGPSASATPASAGFTAQGGTGGTGGTGGDPNERIPGQNGGTGTNASNQIIPPSGKGGDSWLGIGGMNFNFQGPALPGSGYGWGPTGPVSNVSQPAKNGLAGGPGVCIVREWR